MIDALLLVAPFFLIVLVGYAAGKLGVFNAAGLDGLNAFIFKIALPPLLFRVMSSGPSNTAEALPYLAAYGAATLGVYVFARLVGFGVFGLRGGAAALYGHLSINGNVGFLGLPLVAAALGPEALLPAALALVFDLAVVMALTTLSLEAASGSGGIARALGRAFLNPIILAVFAGLAWRFGVDAGMLERIPPDLAPGAEAAGAAMGRFLDLLGPAAAPAALFATGATLAHKALDRRVAELGSITLWKLALHPLATLAAFWASAPETPALWISAAVLVAANPASNNAVVFAGVYRIYEARASATVLISTALSIATFAAFVAFLPRLV